MSLHLGKGLKAKEQVARSVLVAFGETWVVLVRQSQFSACCLQIDGRFPFSWLGKLGVTSVNTIPQLMVIATKIKELFRSLHYSPTSRLKRGRITRVKHV